MISRALGPALGGSIGLMFTVANTISVATYTIGFSESLLDFLQVFLALSISKHQMYRATMKYISNVTMLICFALFQDIIPSWNGIVTPLDECAVAGCRPNDVRIVGAPVLCVFLFIAFAGEFYF